MDMPAMPPNLEPGHWWDALRRFVSPLWKVLFHIFKSLVLTHQRFDVIFLSPHPSHKASGRVNALVNRQVYRQW